jgi:uncharacterized protein (TIGR03437 family)
MNDACGIEAVTATGFANLNAAALKPGVLAQNSIVTAFGTGFATATASADTIPAPTTLADVTVNVRDSAGVTRSAPLLYVSPTQINYVIPDGTSAGAATVSIVGGSTSLQVPVQIAAVSPGLFAIGELAAANLLTVRDGTQSFMNVVQADAGGNLVPIPVDLGTADQQVFLILYGTGIRNHMDPVTATIGNAAVTAAYAGEQGTFAGEDQVNVLLPQTLRGAGVVDVTLTVDGQTTNTVKVHIR